MEAERSMTKKPEAPLYGVNGGLSKASRLLHSSTRFCLDLDIVSLELYVKAGMSKLQGLVETFALNHTTYPRNQLELSDGLGSQLFINPFTRKPERPSIGKASDEKLATKEFCLLRPGEIEFSSVKKGANYIIRGGGANGQALAGPSPGSTYVLSGNLRTDNQP